MSTSNTAQYGFYFDQSRCTACYTCAVACKVWNNLPSGPVKWLRIYEWETGSFPTPEIDTLFAPCYHCSNPVCVDAANGAMYKEPKYGAVLIDPDKAGSASIRAAWSACPYGAIAFDSDSPNANASKCTMCIDRLEQGLLPVCVASCQMRALDFGPIDTLRQKYGSNAQLAGMPSSSTSSPAVVFKPKDARKQVVTMSPERVLSLMASRDPLPSIYDTPSDATETTDGLVGRDGLNMKANGSQQLLQQTRNDDG